MESPTVKLIDNLDVTHDVKCCRPEKPDGYNILPGQATELTTLGRRTAPFLTNL